MCLKYVTSATKPKNRQALRPSAPAPLNLQLWWATKATQMALHADYDKPKFKKINLMSF